MKQCIHEAIQSKREVAEVDSNSAGRFKPTNKQEGEPIHKNIYKNKHFVTHKNVSWVIHYIIVATLFNWNALYLLMVLF